MSNRLFQGIIHQMKDAVDRVIGLIDENGVIISCSELVKIGESRQGIRDELAYTTDVAISGGYTYRIIGTDIKSEYVVFVEGEDKTAEKLSMVLAISLSNIKNLYDEKYDKSSFIKNVILDNILPSDIYIKSKELRFAADVVRIVFLIRFIGKNEMNPYDMVQNMFPDKSKDYVISVGEQEIVLVKEIKPNHDMKEIEKTARQIADTISAEFYTKVVIGIGTAVDNIKDLARSFKEAQVALEVGKVFDTEKSIISYENLGIGRLIYQLPTTLCEMFLQEVFKKGSLESLDRETLMTIQCFFENNLNVSETSRKLFVHRNTLVYRLEKIRKLTGLDLREFEHAITFKVALMVKKYLSSKPAKF
ncbi:MAG: helix-turn-helix domain-containing protein [Eubacteriales bacterium]|nr:helix-turn-helix domain-containing protein [Eubacteriales bacterium]